MFIDTHSHNSDEAFGSAMEQDAVVRRALDTGIAAILQADIDSRERPSMMALVDRHPGVLFPMVGLYPGSVKEDWQDEIDALMPWLESRSDVVAIGEIGLDYHYGNETSSLQKDALKAQLELAARLSLPVNIHMREATEDFFCVLESCRGLALRGNIHAFSGSAETFRRLQKYGDWSVGIGGVVTFKNSHLARELEEIPLERIVLETDAPYLAPVPLRGSRNDSSNIPLIASKIAQIKGLTLQEVERQTTSNALILFDRISCRMK